MMKYVRIAAVFIGLVSLGACAPNANVVSTQMPDGAVFAAATARPGVDAQATMAALYRPGPDGSLHQVSGEVAIGPTVGGQAAVAVAGTVPAALVQGAAGIAIADMKGNCGDNCGGDQYYIGGGTAVAGANAESNSGANVNVAVRNRSGGGKCSACGLAK